jgi:hypothetical protein
MIAAVFYAHMIPALLPNRAPLRLLVLGGACFGAGLGAQVQALKASQVWSEIWSEDTVSAHCTMGRRRNCEYLTSCPQSQHSKYQSQHKVSTIPEGGHDTVL